MEVREEMLKNYMNKCYIKYNRCYGKWFEYNFRNQLGPSNRALGLIKMMKGRERDKRRYFLLRALMDSIISNPGDKECERRFI